METGLWNVTRRPPFPPREGQGRTPVAPKRNPALKRRVPWRTLCAMSTKQIVQDLLQKLPDDVSLHDVAQEIEFVAAVRQGLAEIERGERIPIEEIERELPSWVIR